MNTAGPQTPIGARFSSTRPPSFGGLGDAVSSAIGFVDGNRLAELASTDILGMCLPRTGIEAFLRPSGYRGDAARETAIREFSGLVMNTVAVGGFSYLFLQMLGNHVNWHNPQGLPGRAWISADSMEAFGSLYERILNDASSPQEARQRFIQTILSGMASANKKAGLTGMLKAAEGLDAKARSAFLEPVFSDNPEALEKLKSILKENPASLVQYAGELDPSYSAKLSGQALADLENHFSSKQGLFDAQAARQAQGTLLENPKVNQYLSKEHLDALQKLPEAERYDRLLELLPEQAQAEARQAFLKARLQLALGELRYGENGMIGHADRLALGGGLTDTVQLLDERLEPLIRGGNGKPLMMSKSRKTLLAEMKHFLEHYVDRAAYEARRADDWKKSIHETLYGKPDQAPGGFWRKGLAKAEDGLIPAAIKGKWAFTWIPFGLTILTSVAVAFYNNWLTQQKHGGRVISPIDGSSREGPAPSMPVASLAKNQESAFASSFQPGRAQSASPFAIFEGAKSDSNGGKEVLA
jgi:hypothetical protein